MHIFSLFEYSVGIQILLPLSKHPNYLNTVQWESLANLANKKAFAKLKSSKPFHSSVHLINCATHLPNFFSPTAFDETIRQTLSPPSIPAIRYLFQLQLCVQLNPLKHAWLLTHLRVFIYACHKSYTHWLVWCLLYMCDVLLCFV